MLWNVVSMETRYQTLANESVTLLVTRKLLCESFTVKRYDTRMASDNQIKFRSSAR